MALLASPEQRQALDRIGGLMSLLEGHGDMVMNRAAEGRAAQAPRFASVLQQRRQRSGRGQAGELPGGPRRQAQAVRAGERFIEAVEKAGGRELFQRVWQGPEWLPTLAEIRQPWRLDIEEPRGSGARPDQVPGRAPGYGAGRPRAAVQ